MVTVLTFGHTWGHGDCIRFFQHVLGMDFGDKDTFASIHIQEKSAILKKNLENG